MTARLVLYSLAGLLFLVFFTNKKVKETDSPINILIGDISFKEKYGVIPS